MGKKIYYKGFGDYIWNYKQKLGNDSISDSFVEVMVIQLCKYFLEKTGIDMTKSKGKIGYTINNIWDLGYETKGDTGVLKGALVCFYMQVAGNIKWKAKDGSIIYPHDQVDEGNIEFWFEDLDVEWAKREWKLYATPPKLGFKLPTLNYILSIDHFNEHLYLLILFKENNEEVVKSTVQVLNQMLNDWNEASLAKNRRLGIIHNWKDEKITSNNLKFYIDYGSASEKLLKQILEALNDLEGIEKVTITSYPDEE